MDPLIGNLDKNPDEKQKICSFLLSNNGLPLTPEAVAKMLYAFPKTWTEHNLSYRIDELEDTIENNPVELPTLVSLLVAGYGGILDTRNLLRDNPGVCEKLNITTSAGSGANGQLGELLLDIMGKKNISTKFFSGRRFAYIGLSMHQLGDRLYLSATQEKLSQIDPTQDRFMSHATVIMLDCVVAARKKYGEEIDHIALLMQSAVLWGDPGKTKYMLQSFQFSQESLDDALVRAVYYRRELQVDLLICAGSDKAERADVNSRFATDRCCRLLFGYDYNDQYEGPNDERAESDMKLFLGTKFLRPIALLALPIVFAEVGRPDEPTFRTLIAGRAMSSQPMETDDGTYTLSSPFCKLSLDYADYESWGDERSRVSHLQDAFRAAEGKEQVEGEC